VNILDFAFDGKPIVIAAWPLWCTPCRFLQEYMSTGELTPPPTGSGDSYPWWTEEFAGARDLLLEGKIHWVSVVFGSPEDVAAYHEAYPSEFIPLLSDGGGDSNDPGPLATWLASGGTMWLPHVGVLDEELQYILFSDEGPAPGLQALMDLGL